MVVINLKVSEKNQFLHEAITSDPVEKVLKDCVLSNIIKLNLNF